jgi:hypothetical protein
MSYVIKVSILFVQAVVRQVNKNILNILTPLIFLRCKTHKTIFVKKYSHWINHRCYQNINSKVKLVLFPQSRVLYIFLNYIRIVFVDFIWRLLDLIILFGIGRLWFIRFLVLSISLRGVVRLFSFHVLIIVLLLLF